MARIYRGADPCFMRVGDVLAEFQPGDTWPGDPDAVLSAEWVDAPTTPTTPAAGKRAEKD